MAKRKAPDADLDMFGSSSPSKKQKVAEDGEIEGSIPASGSSDQNSKSSTGGDSKSAHSHSNASSDRTDSSSKHASSESHSRDKGRSKHRSRSRSRDRSRHSDRRDTGRRSSRDRSRDRRSRDRSRDRHRSSHHSSSSSSHRDSRDHRDRDSHKDNRDHRGGDRDKRDARDSRDSRRDDRGRDSKRSSDSRDSKSLDVKVEVKEVKLEKSADDLQREKEAEEAYQRKVLAELEEQQKQQSSEDAAEERRKRRMAFMQQQQTAAAAPVKQESKLNGTGQHNDSSAMQVDTVGGNAAKASPKVGAKKAPQTPPAIETKKGVSYNSNSNLVAPSSVKVVPSSSAERKRDDTEPSVEERVVEDDMFSDNFQATTLKTGQSGAGAELATLTDNWDDPDGYYHFRLGDMLDNNRYRVYSNSGGGVFSTVMRVIDTMIDDREMIIKVIRNNDVMRKAGMKEVEILRTLAAADPENKKHVIRLQSYFDHRNHLCLVFEPMHMNLRQLLRKFNNSGIALAAVRSYAKQLLTALKLLSKCQIMHADIKPDNILVNENMKKVKLCDFGSASTVKECEITPYLVSRFYRAPEIMLGLEYNEAIDMWSIGCVLYELYTGKILFSGRDNNEMLYQIQEIKGKFNNKLLNKAKFIDQHFDHDRVFELRKKDPITNQILIEKFKFPKPTKDLKQILIAATPSANLQTDHKRLMDFVDLLGKMFELTPARRITVDQALKHPFIADVAQVVAPGAPSATTTTSSSTSSGTSTSVVVPAQGAIPMSS